MWAVRLQSVRPVGPTGLADQSDVAWVGPTSLSDDRTVYTPSKGKAGAWRMNNVDQPATALAMLRGSLQVLLF